METDLYFALRQISLAVAIVLHANHPIEVRSESSLKGFVNFFINQVLPDVIDIRTAFISHQYEKLEESHWTLIHSFNCASRNVFPFHIHLKEIKDIVLLESMRFAYYIFNLEDTDMFSALNLCFDDNYIIDFVKNILYNFEEYPNTCPDRSFLLDMRIHGFINRLERKTKKGCFKHNAVTELNDDTKTNNNFSQRTTRKNKRAPLKGCTQTALQVMGLLNKREKSRRDSALGFSF